MRNIVFIFSLCASTAVFARQPSYPVWPRQFRATFTVFDSLEQPWQPPTEGQLDYNFDILASKTTISSPQGGFAILMRPSKMYLTFSLDDSRCEVSDGVGIPYPDWLARSEARYDGIQLINEQRANAWSYVLQSDVRVDTFRYFEDAQTRTPIRFEEETSQDAKTWILRFDYTSFEAMPRDPALFEVPESCHATT
jgi:hypothetical protein